MKRTTNPKKQKTKLQLWMKHLGKTRQRFGERKQIDQRVDAAFEQVDRELWERSSDGPD